MPSRRTAPLPEPVLRFDVYWVNLDPTIGSELRKKRPGLVISPDEMNRAIRTVIIAPMTTQGQPYPTRVACTFNGRAQQIVLEQIRTIDKARLAEKMGRIDETSQIAVLDGLAEMFAP